jgi:TctA family transporter
MMKNIDVDDDEIYCNCGVCQFGRFVVPAITFNNYAYFIMISALFEIYSGHILTNYLYFTLGYSHLVYILKLLKYNTLSNIIFMMLLPLYYKLYFTSTTFSLENTFDLHNQIIKFIIMIQAICFVVKSMFFVNKLFNSVQEYSSLFS